ncbi:MAG: biotin/lipoyl-binding protein [Clostridia bacterium]|nr:biotin/lipoyl-binding protein [Clostridia bacterium]
MKLYRVKVNGKVYEVELEAVSEKEGSITAAPAAAQAAAPAAAPASGSKTIDAPIAGKVVAVKVSVGDTVKKGQTVAVIEAMKLENEVPATADGKVVEIKAAAGTVVSNKDVLIVLA